MNTFEQDRSNALLSLFLYFNRKSSASTPNSVSGDVAALIGLQKEIRQTVAALYEPNIDPTTEEALEAHMERLEQSIKSILENYKFEKLTVIREPRAHFNITIKFPPAMGV